MVSTVSVTSWLRDALLPTVVLVLGAVLLVRFVHWIGGIHRASIDARIRDQIEAGIVVSEEAKRSRAVSEAVEWTATAVTFVLAIVLAIDLLGVPLTSLVAPATVAGVAIGFGAQQVVGDVLAGFFLFAEHQFGFGDVIRLSVPGQTTGVTGTVEELTLRVTKLRTSGGEQIIVPNSALRQVTNLSKDWSRAVVDVPIPVEEDLEEVTTLLRGVLDAMKQDARWNDRLLGNPVIAGVETIDVGYVRLRLIARTLPGKQFDVERELRYRAAMALRAAGITSPTAGGAG